MSVLEAAEVKSYLNMQTTADEDIQPFIDAAEAAVVARCGPLVTTIKEERVRGGRSQLVVASTPLVSLTSVVAVGGSAVDVDDLMVLPGGVVEFTDGGCFGSRWYDVTYESGHAANAADVPDDLREAVLALVKHLWGPKRGGTMKPSGGTPEAPGIPGAAYLFTYRVEQLIAPYLQPGFA